MKTFAAALVIAALAVPAQATNYFTWDCETSITSIGAVVSWGSGTTLSTASAHNGTHSMRLVVEGDDDLNQQMGAETGNFSYGFSALGSSAIYYRWWMKFATGFHWGGSAQKAKSNRVLSGSSAKYTGYVASDGITIGECTDQAGCLAQGGTSNSSDTVVRVDYDFQTAVDNQWHEYIVMVKPNTSTSALDAQLSLYVDNVLIGSYNNWKLTNANYTMSEAWGGWMVRPYFQMGGSSSDGGTIYLDDFSVDDTYNSTYSGGSDTTPPVTTASPVAGTYTSNQSVTLSCSDNVACSTTYYCLGASCTPTTVYSAPVAITSTNTIRYYSTDSSGNSETVKSGSYVISIPALPECQNWQVNHPEWIFCDDFESSSPLVASGRYFEYENPVSFLRTSGAGYGGSYGMQSNWQTGTVDNGNLKLAFGRNPASGMTNGINTTQDYRDIYYRIYLKLNTGWSGNPDKLSRAIVFSGSDWSQAAIGHLWGGTTTHLAVEPISCVTGSTVDCVGYNDLAHFQWLGAVSGTTALFDGNHNDQWYCVESHMRLNDAGQSNGVEEHWLDGNLEATHTGLNFVGSYSSYGINAIFFENYWNSGSTKVQSRVFDNIVVSTQRVGCDPGSSSPPPVITPHGSFTCSGSFIAR